MFNRKTLFILGAGASCEAGLPDGEKLKSAITSMIKLKHDEYGMARLPNSKFFHALSSVGNLSAYGDISPYVNSLIKITDAMPFSPSIDNVLDLHRDDEDAVFCGKLAIVCSIIEAERNSKLYIDPHSRRPSTIDPLEGKWFNEFCRLLLLNVPTKDLEKIFENVSFINFNYDRCLEHYLVNAIPLAHKISHQQSVELLQELKVIHPYGVIGGLPWQSHPSTTLEFGSETTNAHNLLGITNEIKTFTEQIEDELMVQSIKTLVDEAQTVVFLGFAFHSQNMELLSVGQDGHPKRVYGTALDISKSDVEIIRNQLDDIIKYDSPRELADLTCVEMFKTFSRSLMSAS
jgi:hypothetical protein